MSDRYLVIGIVVVEMFLVCHVMKEDYEIKGLGDYNDRNHSM